MAAFQEVFSIMLNRGALIVRPKQPFLDRTTARKVGKDRDRVAPYRELPGLGVVARCREHGKADQLTWIEHALRTAGARPAHLERGPVVAMCGRHGLCSNVGRRSSYSTATILPRQTGNLPLGKCHSKSASVGIRNPARSW